MYKLPDMKAMQCKCNIKIGKIQLNSRVFMANGDLLNVNSLLMLKIKIIGYKKAGYS